MATRNRMESGGDTLAFSEPEINDYWEMKVQGRHLDLFVETVDDNDRFVRALISLDEDETLELYRMLKKTLEWHVN